MYRNLQSTLDDEGDGGFNPFQSPSAHLPNSRPSGMIHTNRPPARRADPSSAGSSHDQHIYNYSIDSPHFGGFSSAAQTTQDHHLVNTQFPSAAFSICPDQPIAYFRAHHNMALSIRRRANPQNTTALVPSNRPKRQHHNKGNSSSPLLMHLSSPPPIVHQHVPRRIKS